VLFYYHKSLQKTSNFVLEAGSPPPACSTADDSYEEGTGEIVNDDDLWEKV